VEAGATNEWKRMIEWMDGDGVVHQEDASITLSITSSWGTFSQTIDAPTTAEGSMELALPYVAVTSVSPESTTAVANKSVSGMVSVSNTGDADVSGVSIWCYNGDEVVDTTQIVVSLTAGESKDVPFTWYMYEAGDAMLTCKPLLPSALNGISTLVVDTTGADSEIVTWEYEEEIEEFPLIIWIVVALGFGGLALVIATQARKQTMAKSYTAYEEAEEETDDEEVDEEKTSSIYDMKPESED
jgi:hypothetical protein